MMTKKEMIETMQEREAIANKELDHWIAKYGRDHKDTDLYLWAWAEIYELMEELGIPTKRRGA